MIDCGNNTITSSKKFTTCIFLVFYVGISYGDIINFSCVDKVNNLESTDLSVDTDSGRMGSFRNSVALGCINMGTPSKRMPEISTSEAKMTCENASFMSILSLSRNTATLRVETVDVKAPKDFNIPIKLFACTRVLKPIF